MRVFKTRAFHKWAKKAPVTDQTLRKSVDEIKTGLVEAELGGGVVKKRVSITGRGKRGGARTIVAFKSGKNIFFIYGFAKNERSNITKTELIAFKKLAVDLFDYDATRLEKAMSGGALIEVTE